MKSIIRSILLELCNEVHKDKATHPQARVLRGLPSSSTLVRFKLDCEAKWRRQYPRFVSKPDWLTQLPLINC